MLSTDTYRRHRMPLRNGKFLHWSLLVLTLAIGAGSVRVFDTYQTSQRLANRRVSPKAAHPLRVANSAFRFVHPLLGYELPQRGNFEPYRTMRLAVQSTIARATAAHRVERVSLYYRDLDFGSWFGIDEQQAFSPASLAKVPLMIAYYKMAEAQSEILKQRVQFTMKHFDAPEQNIVPTDPLVIGRTYRVEELLRAMIIQSDNEAAFLLQGAAASDVLAGVYSDLNIDPPNFQDPNATIAPETYARFFRFLYNGTYLSPEYSERALELLTASAFHRGLGAGVPNGIALANKFGERYRADAVSGTAAAQLHDCGIIYHPERPYLLCVMTSGWSFDDLTQTIAEISRVAYQEVDRIATTGSNSRGAQ